MSIVLIPDEGGIYSVLCIRDKTIKTYAEINFLAKPMNIQ